MRHLIGLTDEGRPPRTARQAVASSGSKPTKMRIRVWRPVFSSKNSSRPATQPQAAGSLLADAAVERRAATQLVARWLVAVAIVVAAARRMPGSQPVLKACTMPQHAAHHEPERRSTRRGCRTPAAWPLAMPEASQTRRRARRLRLLRSAREDAARQRARQARRR